MTADSTKLAQQFIDALHALEAGTPDDTDAIVALFSEDATLTNPALERAGETRSGRDEVRAFWTEYRKTFGAARSDFHRVTTTDDAAGLFWTTRGTGTDDQPMQYDGVTLLVFDDSGKIKEFRGYYDTRQLEREVGVDRGAHS